MNRFKHTQTFFQGNSQGDSKTKHVETLTASQRIFPPESQTDSQGDLRTYPHRRSNRLTCRQSNSQTNSRVDAETRLSDRLTDEGGQLTNGRINDTIQQQIAESRRPQTHARNNGLVHMESQSASHTQRYNDLHRLIHRHK